MKRPYEVYRLYKKIQKAYFSRAKDECLRVCPENCRFNREVRFVDRNTSVRLCSLGQDKDNPGGVLDPSKLLMCSTVKQAAECNAYSALYKTDEDVAQSLIAGSPTQEAKRAKFPEVYLLEWVMANSLHKLRMEKPGVPTKALFWAIGRLESLILRLNKDNKSLLEDSKD